MKRMAYLMVLPALLVFLLFPAAATYLVGHLSLFKTDYLTWKFVGLQNYINIMSDVKFWRSISNGLFYAAVIVPGMISVALLFAFLACDFSLKAQNAVKVAMYIPCLTAGIIISNVWKWIYAEKGLANWFLGLAGMAPIPWLTDGTVAKIAISIMMIASVFGGYLIIALASIVSIPRQLWEAAHIDGATNLQIKFHIILPNIMPTVYLMIMIGIIQSMQIWEFIYRMTGGGPSGGTATPVFDIYATAFTYGNYGLASAKSLVLMIIIFILVASQKRIERLGK